MRKTVRETSMGNLFMGRFNPSWIKFVCKQFASVNKAFEETQLKQAFVVNAGAKGYSFDDDEIPERMFRSFYAAVSTYLGKVKISKADEAVALVLTDIGGEFKFAGIVEYHENENPDEPGNWSYVTTFNEEDLESVAKKKKLKKFLCGDDAFKNVFDKVSYDIGGISFEHERFMYDACLLCVDTFIGVLDAEAKEDETVDIELPGYFTLSVAVESGEKVFAITPDGAMKELIKSDIDLDK